MKDAASNKMGFHFLVITKMEKQIFVFHTNMISLRPRDLKRLLAFFSIPHSIIFKCIFVLLERIHGKLGISDICFPRQSISCYSAHVLSTVGFHITLRFVISRVHY